MTTTAVCCCPSADWGSPACPALLQSIWRQTFQRSCYIFCIIRVVAARLACQALESTGVWEYHPGRARDSENAASSRLGCTDCIRRPLSETIDFEIMRLPSAPLGQSINYASSMNYNWGSLFQNTLVWSYVVRTGHYSTSSPSSPRQLSTDFFTAFLSIFSSSSTRSV